ncbi:stage II sporulation protein D [Bacillus sp. OV322]|uniref:stage II sporulation protein D n=1 Tax=Bacillus sp. OV322 TaxID=1882764 RepID=UPI000B862138|nr:stage II sporulation protein D [Bacillus sp. OV322]
MLKAIKPFIALFIAAAFVLIMVPALLVLPFSGKEENGRLSQHLEGQVRHEGKKVNAISEPAIEVSVYRAQSRQIQKFPLESYVAGVVAAEMPADFKIEALKAQALTARTYIVNQLMAHEKAGLPDGADVSDTIKHQVFRNDEELKKEWGSQYKDKLSKITKAVAATSGQILTYNGKPIQALFFSTSNGYTENSEDYWSSSIPYLKSVSSPWDKSSPKFYYKKTIPVSEFERKLGIHLSSGNAIGTVTKRTPGKRVGTVDFGNKKLTGKQIRETLDLKSSDFEWVRKGSDIVITTKGFGHGVGMSQYGANGMAEQGKDYKSIVKYYYRGVEIQSSNNLLHTLTARK